MDPWQLEPARDLGLRGMDRYRSLERESGLVESGARLVWWTWLRTTFRCWNRLTVVGREHLPEPPFVVIANHESHLDALLLSACLPLRWRDCTFPVAARDVFFERSWLAAFSAMFINSLPIFRGPAGSRGLKAMRDRLLRERCILLLFPEGTRTRDGSMNHFKSGIGMLVAGTEIPVVPAHIRGAYQAFPPGKRLVRPRKIAVQLGAALRFAELPNKRAGWTACTAQLEAAVAALASGGSTAARDISHDSTAALAAAFDPANENRMASRHDDHDGWPVART